MTYHGEPPFQKHSPTSIAAASAIKPDAKTLRAKVLAFIESCHAHGATDEEVQTALHMEGSTQRPRRCELVERGDVMDSDRVRKTRSGRSAVVWITKPKQKQLL